MDFWRSKNRNFGQLRRLYPALPARARHEPVFTFISSVFQCGIKMKLCCCCCCCCCRVEKDVSAES